jgi:hypothetical protein
MSTRCPLIVVALLSGALLFAAAATATAEESEVELWLRNFGPVMTGDLAEQIERNSSRELAPIVERRLLAATGLGATSAGPPPAALAFAIDTKVSHPSASMTSMSCVAVGASSISCVVRPLY